MALIIIIGFRVLFALFALSSKMLSMLLPILEKGVDLGVAWGVFWVCQVELDILNDGKGFYEVLNFSFDKSQATLTKK